MMLASGYYPSHIPTCRPPRCCCLADPNWPLVISLLLSYSCCLRILLLPCSSSVSRSIGPSLISLCLVSSAMTFTRSPQSDPVAGQTVTRRLSTSIPTSRQSKLTPPPTRHCLTSLRFPSSAGPNLLSSSPSSTESRIRLSASRAALYSPMSMTSAAPRASSPIVISSARAPSSPRTLRATRTSPARTL